MKLQEEGHLLRILIGEDDTHKGNPLYESIVLKARELGLAGATVFKGIMGYGANSILHTSKILRLSTDLPIIVEIVDTENNINRLIPFLDETVKDGLITMEKVRVIRYMHNQKDIPQDI